MVGQGVIVTGHHHPTGDKGKLIRLFTVEQGTAESTAPRNPQGVIVTGYQHPTGDKSKVMWMTINAPGHSRVHSTQEPSWVGQEVFVIFVTDYHHPKGGKDNLTSSVVEP